MQEKWQQYEHKLNYKVVGRPTIKLRRRATDAPSPKEQRFGHGVANTLQIVSELFLQKLNLARNESFTRLVAAKIAGAMPRVRFN